MSGVQSAGGRVEEDSSDPLEHGLGKKVLGRLLGREAWSWILNDEHIYPRRRERGGYSKAGVSARFPVKGQTEDILVFTLVGQKLLP